MIFVEKDQLLATMSATHITKTVVAGCLTCRRLELSLKTVVQFGLMPVPGVSVLDRLSNRPEFYLNKYYKGERSNPLAFFYEIYHRQERVK